MDSLVIDQQPDFAVDNNGSAETNLTEIAQAGPATESIGRIDVINGTVEVVRADGSKSALQEGDAIFQGDVIETGGDGSVSMVMADDTVFSLDHDGKIAMDEMVYDPTDQSGQMSVSLVKGVFSFVSGGLAKTDPDAMVLTTPVATIGIRGTTGVLDTTGSEPLQVVLAPNADGTTGELVISNDSGVQIMNVAFQALKVAGLNIPIGQPIVIPAAQVPNLVNVVQNSANKIGNTGGVTRSDNSSNQGPISDDDEDGDDAEGGSADLEGDSVERNSLIEQSDDLSDAIQSFAQKLGVEVGAMSPEDTLTDVIDYVEGKKNFEGKGNGKGKNKEKGKDDSNIETEDDEDTTIEEETELQIDDLTDTIAEGADEDDEDAPGNSENSNGNNGSNENTNGNNGNGNGNDNNNGNGNNNSSNTIDGSGNSSFAFTTSDDSVTGSSGDDVAGPTNNAASGDDVDLGAGNDTLNLYAGDNTLSVQNVETINGNNGNDNVTIATAISGGVVDLAGGSGDKVTLSSTAGNSLTISNVEEVQGSDGADNVTVSQADLSGNSFEGNDGVDTLTISDGGTLTSSNLSAVTEFEMLVLAADADYNITLDPSMVGAQEGSITINGTALTSSSSSLTLDGSGETNASISINSGAGDDVLTGGNKADIISGNAGADTLIGGGGNDTLTGGDGADTLTGDGGKNIFNYTAASEFGDTITDFNTGNSQDSIDLDATTVSSLVGTGYTEVNSNGSVSSSEGFVVIKTSLGSAGDQQVAATVATQLNMLSGLVANDARIFVIGDGTDARVWKWEDSGDGVVDSGELSSVADLTGVDNLNQFAESNFADAA